MGVAARPMANIAHLWSDTKDRIDDRMEAVAAELPVAASRLIGCRIARVAAAAAAGEVIVPLITADAIGLIGLGGVSFAGSVVFCFGLFRCFEGGACVVNQLVGLSEAVYFRRLQLHVRVIPITNATRIGLNSKALNMAQALIIPRP